MQSKYTKKKRERVEYILISLLGENLQKQVACL